MRRENTWVFPLSQVSWWRRWNKPLWHFACIDRMFSFIFPLPCSLGIDFHQTLLEKAVWIAVVRVSSIAGVYYKQSIRSACLFPQPLTLIRDSSTIWLSPWRPASDRATPGWWQLFMTLTIAATLKSVLPPPSSSSPPSYLPHNFPCLLQTAVFLFLPPWDRGLRVLEYHWWLPDPGFLLHHCLATMFFFFASWTPACSSQS